ncbi:bacterial proteasome activator family protein [Arthrobacter sp. TWP1-1]|uniref:bacterial proteasome activator family protein n=1 Tax=Arthrobacter sp. TWP1-1 TaxID=2804568 RepID=UPI003CFB2B45
MSDEAKKPAADQPAEGKIVESSAATKDVVPEAARKPASVADMVDQPDKVMRIGTMIKQLLDEVKSAPLDDAARSRLAEIHQASIKELEDGLAPELVDELHRLSLPFTEKTAPSDAELRIAQAQLVGWLEGLFHGIQTALAVQAMANQQTAARLAHHQLPPGTVLAPGVIVGENGEPQRAPSGQQSAGAHSGDSGFGRQESADPGQYL